MIIEDMKKGKEWEDVGICPYCRISGAKSDEEYVTSIKKLMGNGNATAFYKLAFDYFDGEHGLQQDMTKANELLLKAGELGCADAYYNLGVNYDVGGRDVEIEKKKAKHYYEQAAMMGDVESRHYLGVMEGKAGISKRAYKHFLLAAKYGCKDSLQLIKTGFMDGIVTKDEYGQALRAYQKQHDEMKSDKRDEAADFLARIHGFNTMNINLR